MNFLRSLSPILDLIYPQLCIACKKRFPISDDKFCLHCKNKLPYLDYHYRPDNSLSRRLDSVVDISSATAMFAFHSGELVQSLIHDLKYSNRSDIGYELGKAYGAILKKTALHKAFDVIIPVPIHKKRLAYRGYNQSDFFANGLGESLEMQVDTTSIKRIKNTETQTKKSKSERLANIRNAFTIHRPKPMSQYKHVLWVDDVITTGATICACIDSCLPISRAKHSVACIATKDYL